MYVLDGPDLHFEWNPEKARKNARKHGVSFHEAATVFLDEEGLLIEEQDHSAEEGRFVLLGLSAALRLLVVVHCLRAEGRVIRIISARKASKTEVRDYGERLER
jgi:uncharacterized DUF497 family protein